MSPDDLDLLRQADVLTNGAAIIAALGLAVVVVSPIIMAILDMRGLDHLFRRFMLLALVVECVIAFHVVSAWILGSRIAALERVQDSYSCGCAAYASIEKSIGAVQAAWTIADWAIWIIAVVIVLKVFERPRHRLGLFS